MTTVTGTITHPITGDLAEGYVTFRLVNERGERAQNASFEGESIVGDSDPILLVNGAYSTDGLAPNSQIESTETQTYWRRTHSRDARTITVPDSGTWDETDLTALIPPTVPAATSVGDLIVSGDAIVTGSLTAYHPLIFWQHPVAVTYPSGTNLWTPVPFNSLLTTVGQVSDWTSYVPAATTIAAGSNGAVLPQGTINVVSTAGFAASGYLVVRISGTDRVIRFTGLNATQFTGCTLGIGTLATGQAIAQANVAFTVPLNLVDTVGPAIAEVAFAANPDGDRGLRFRQSEGPQFFGGTKTERACINNVHHIQTCEQPKTGLLRVEAMQDSGDNLDGVVDQLAAPRLVIQALSAVAL